MEGDIDLDGDVGLVDFAALQNCFVGGGISDSCLALDIDNTDVVDLIDYTAFQSQLNGPTVQPIP